MGEPVAWQVGDKNEEERQTAKYIQPKITGLGGGCSIRHDSQDRQDADKGNGRFQR